MRRWLDSLTPAQWFTVCLLIVIVGLAIGWKLRVGLD